MGARCDAQIAREVLDGKPGAPLEVVIANAGAAMYVGGGAKSIREGATRVREVIRSGAAKRKLDELVMATNES